MSGKFLQHLAGACFLDGLVGTCLLVCDRGVQQISGSIRPWLGEVSGWVGACRSTAGITWEVNVRFLPQFWGSVRWLLLKIEHSESQMLKMAAPPLSQEVASRLYPFGASAFASGANAGASVIDELCEAASYSRFPRLLPSRIGGYLHLVRRCLSFSGVFVGSFPRV
jgi:hypothetical protein